MRFFLYLTIVLSLSYSNILAQKSEVGLMLGGSVYSGDLSPHLINIDFINPAGGLFYRYNLDHHWSLKAIINYGTIEGDDSKSSEIFEKNRNLQFQSRLLELSGNIEFNFFQFEIGDRKRPFTPYIFTGLSLFDFNPQANYQDGLVDLHPLGTEGQRLAVPTKAPYSLVQLAVPIGAGIKWSLTQKLCLGVEIGARKTFTDYLDDVSGAYPDLAVLRADSPLAANLSDRSINKSADIGGRQRGTSMATDWYTFGGITLSLKIGTTTKVSCDPFESK